MAQCVTVIGDGAMGTVCAQILAEKGVRVKVWGFDGAYVQQMAAARENVKYLPGFKLHDNISVTADDAAAFKDCDLIVAAVPTQFIRGVMKRLQPHVPATVPIVNIAKGIEVSTLKRPTQIILEALGGARVRPVGVLSGPNIASEIARKLPATMVVAADADGLPVESHADDALAKRVQELFNTSYVRVYRNTDVIGVEFAGALKNVIAIAAGILDGMRAGNNAKAALLTRGLVEITRLGVAVGAKAETFMGLAGLGDLVTTCVSPEGRNRSFGERIGKGETVDAVLKSMVGVVEGVPTTKGVVQLAKEKGVEMPICEGLHEVLFKGIEPRAALVELMSRELKREVEK